MDYKEKATILRVCSSKNGERCSRCPAFGQGDRHCMKNAMKDGAAAITDLLARAEYAEDKIKQMTPCDRCEYGPPSSGDGKPCSFCPASKKED